MTVGVVGIGGVGHPAVTRAMAARDLAFATSTNTDAAFAFGAHEVVVSRDAAPMDAQARRGGFSLATARQRCCRCVVDLRRRTPSSRLGDDPRSRAKSRASQRAAAAESASIGPTHLAGDLFDRRSRPTALTLRPSPLISTLPRRTRRRADGNPARTARCTRMTFWIGL